MEDKIFFDNINQVILYKCELNGQISDGNWENSRPFGHYKRMNTAIINIAMDEQQLGCTFQPRRKYNFNDSFLFECVGDRMLFWIKFYKTFPDISLDKHWDIDSFNGESEINTLFEGASRGDHYWVKLKKNLCELLGIKSSKKAFMEIYEKVNSYPFTTKQLRKELRDMSQIVNTMKSDAV